MAEVKKAPPVGTLVDATGPVPRVIHENERVCWAELDDDGNPGPPKRVPDLRRFACRAVNADDGTSYPVGKYILAKDKDSAITCYIEADREHIERAGFDLKTRLRRTDKLPLDVRVELLPD